MKDAAGDGPSMASSILIALCAVNIFTFLTFWRDKACARSGSRRVAEDTLLLLSALGGTPAAFLARHSLRHKTRKQPFSKRLWQIAFAQVILLGAAAGWLVSVAFVTA
jgi:uncharacterized membrane protein YsdA (DUF1294 family)